jgi:dihydrofolate reductase
MPICVGPVARRVDTPTWVDAGLSRVQARARLSGGAEARVLEWSELRFRFDAALRELVCTRASTGERAVRTGFRPGLKLGSGWPMSNAAMPGQQPVETSLDRDHRRLKVSVSVLYMSMSLDGYIAGPNDEPGNPGGDGFARLHEWFGVAPQGEAVQPDGEAGQLIDEYKATGAVLVGRRTAEQVDHYGGDHHGVPIFVVSHRPPGPSVANYPLVTYVTDGIESAMAQAKAAAGDRNVLVHGASTAQRALEAGVLDEVQIHQIPVLFGGGRRLFEVLPSRVELEIVRVIDTPQATYIRYRVRR